MTVDPAQNRLTRLRQIAERWRAGHEPNPNTRLDYLRRLAQLGAALEAPVTLIDSDLDLFRSLIMARPKDMRRRLLGSCLEQLRGLSPTRRRAIRSLGVHPDLLSPFGEMRYEPSHTQLLAYFMNPRRNSELAPMLLLRFLERVELPIAALDPARLRGALVTAEASNEKGRIDLRIETEDVLVFVELKIDAVEGQFQFKRYREALEAQAGELETSLVLVTLDGREDPPEFVDTVLTMDDVLVAWLPFAAWDGAEAGYLARYLKTIALLHESAGPGAFEDWAFAQQRAALRLVDKLTEEDTQ